MQVSQLLAGLTSGNRIALAKAITLVESSNPVHRQTALELLSQLPSKTTSLRIGICGTPGAGKSTLIEALGMLCVSKGKRPAVLAMDPSSIQFGGSILGDKTRMPNLGVCLQAYVRPSPTRGVLGGVTTSCSEAIRICEAAGHDPIIIETVGLGQSETAVDNVTDLVMMVTSPAAGDGLQGIKKGIMEIADIVVMNKVDGPLEKKAGHAKLELEGSIRLNMRRYEEWTPRVVTCSALLNTNIEELWSTLLEARDTLEQWIAKKRAWQNMSQAEQILDSLLKEQIVGLKSLPEYQALNLKLRRGVVLPRQAAYQLLALLRPS